MYREWADAESGRLRSIGHEEHRVRAGAGGWCGSGRGWLRDEQVGGGCGNRTTRARGGIAGAGGAGLSDRALGGREPEQDRQRRDVDRAPGQLDGRVVPPSPARRQARAARGVADHGGRERRVPAGAASARGAGCAGEAGRREGVQAGERRRRAVRVHRDRRGRLGGCRERGLPARRAECADYGSDVRAGWEGEGVLAAVHEGVREKGRRGAGGAAGQGRRDHASSSAMGRSSGSLKCLPQESRPCARVVITR